MKTKMNILNCAQTKHDVHRACVGCEYHHSDQSNIKKYLCK